MYKKPSIKGKGLLAALITFTFSLAVSNPALAVNVSDIAQNMVQTSSGLPGLVAAAAYLLGLLLTVLAVFSLRAHVENPSQTPLRTPIIRLLIGGSLFALPIVYEAMLTAINGGVLTNFEADNVTFSGIISGVVGQFSSFFGLGTVNINGILASIIDSLEKVPALIAAISYLLGLIMGFYGLLKVKEHVENPDQVPIREGATRILVGGALFGLPTVFQAMFTLINGGEGVGLWGQISSLFSFSGFLFSPYADGTFAVCNPLGTSLGAALCGSIISTAAAPAFLSSISYLFGLILGAWGILKIRDHILNPQQTQVWEGFSRFVAGGAFFALPVTVEAIRTSVTPELGTAFGFLDFIASNTTASYSGATLGPDVCDNGNWSPLDLLPIQIPLINPDPIPGPNPAPVSGGLDMMLACAMSDLVGPVHSLLNFFAFTAGIILIMIGVSRLIKSAQDGARGPGGIGTFMTFLAGGALISYNEFIRAITASFFGSGSIKTYAKLAYDTGGDNVIDYTHTYTVISAILKFMIIVGLISFVRGIFIVRSVAEGNGQASLMAGMTHMVAGAMAVNLGPLLQAVQTTLGISQFGLVFS